MVGRSEQANYVCMYVCAYACKTKKKSSPTICACVHLFLNLPYCDTYICKPRLFHSSNKQNPQAKLREFFVQSFAEVSFKRFLLIFFLVFTFFRVFACFEFFSFLPVHAEEGTRQSLLERMRDLCRARTRSRN